MKNIYEILRTIGVEISDENKEKFDKSFTENYKTIAEVDNLKTKLSNSEKQNTELQEQYNTDIKKRDNDLAELQKQLAEAGGQEGKLTELQETLNKWKTDYETIKTDYEKKLSDQRYEFAIKEKVNELQFTSNSAKKAFTHDLMANPLQVKDGKILGFDDFVNNYKEQDAGAFKVDEGSQDENKPKFGGKSGKKSEENEGTEKKKEKPIIW